MGVAYKLRQDIIDFIVQSKRNDTSLSCRKLVSIIKNKYAMDVSKSSVNGVIKEFQLSGPVGRQPRFKAPKNFSIPQDKKTILLQNVQPFLSAQLTALIPEIQRAEIIPKIEPVATESLLLTDPETLLSKAVIPEPDKLNDNQDREQEVIFDDRLLSLRPDPIQSQGLVLVSEAAAHQVSMSLEREQARRENEVPVSVWLGDVGVLYGRLGAAVMWFAFRSACVNSHLGEQLARALEPLAKGISPQQCEALFFTVFFGEHRVGFESDDLCTLWRLSGLEDTHGRQLMERMGEINANKALCAAVRTELSMAFTPVRYFRISTCKGARFHVSSALMILRQEAADANPVEGALPVFMAVERAIDHLITNISPFIADVSAVMPLPELVRFTQLMDGFGEDSFSAVEIIGNNDVRCAEFLSIPRMRRTFILRVRLANNELARVEYDLIENKKKYINEILQCDCTYFEGSLQLDEGGDSCRALIVQPAGGEEFVLLSNIPTADMSSGDALEAFLNVCPSENAGNNSQEQVIFEPLTPVSAEIALVFRDIDALTRQFFIRTFNSSAAGWDEMCQQLYDLPGYIKEHPKALLIRFHIPKDFTFHQPFQLVLKKLNIAAFKTVDGRRIIFSCEF